MAAAAKWFPGLADLLGGRPEDEDSTTGGSGGGMAVVVALGTAGGLLAGGLTLPSCAALEDMQVQGEACYILEDGAKVCITGDGTGRARVRGRIPLYDPETGRVTGWVEGTVRPGPVRAEK